MTDTGRAPEIRKCSLAHQGCPKTWLVPESPSRDKVIETAMDFARHLRDDHGNDEAAVQVERYMVENADADLKRRETESQQGLNPDDG